VGSSVTIRSAEASDFAAWFEVFEEVASEGRWIGAEAPIRAEWASPMFDRLRSEPAAELVVALDDAELVGHISIELERGCAELGMMVRQGARCHGVGSALLHACIEWARDRGAHKVTLSVFPHNEAAIALYRKLGFEAEGRLLRHWRRRNGELWDLIPMGLVLDTRAAGSPFDG
jgi:RimJ/RimL family protein N-acetyltransferase